ncbi:succinate dehydrogenase / fumarate reductase cytochrome b subunit [Sinosporangium album]|uniref:Succinate dehydrogenase / fumarate reductase cytochrome b subunit n=1 Tax=Sinosporangium album TaxID=504805 RepID=A0A1G7Y2D6_9ACTN|nr:succinate dehydrogenase cytochrome b subunit [Sinosporangium album]SDG90608.1 succinate dehydrogenase / fumarate reductase cytochrome b subunit [Sinosporangium album]
MIDRGEATDSVRPPAAHSPKKPTKPAAKTGRFTSTNGKKAVMAVTGAIMVLFLIGHVLGNLKVFSGAQSFNDYAEFLRTAGEPAVPRRTVLTLVEIVLVLAVGLHMWSAISLARRAAKARPVKYAAKRKNQAGGYATRTMRWGGVIIVLFLIWHLLDLTFGVANPAGSAGLPYDRMVQGFAPERWWVTLFYAVSLVMVGLHLRHGLWSAVQTLGLASGRTRKGLQLAAAAFSLVLVIGFLAVPFAVMIGVVK